MQAAENQAYSLICCISDIPGINRQIKVFNGGIEPKPIFSVFDRFQYQNGIGDRFFMILLLTADSRGRPRTPVK